MFRNSREVTIEWGDCDPAGIVFYPRFADMFDSAAAALLEAASGHTRAQLIRSANILGWPMVEIRTRFLAPATFDDRVTIDSEVTHVGQSSFIIRHRLRRGDLLCVESAETRVWAQQGPAAGPPMVPSPIPPELRAKLLGESAEEKGRR